MIADRNTLRTLIISMLDRADEIAEKIIKSMQDYGIELNEKDIEYVYIKGQIVVIKQMQEIIQNVETQHEQAEIH